MNEQQICTHMYIHTCGLAVVGGVGGEICRAGSPGLGVLTSTLSLENSTILYALDMPAGKGGVACASGGVACASGGGACDGGGTAFG